MHQIDNGRERMRPLIAGMEYHLSVHAFAAGTMPGWVYVDDADRPRSAFAYNSEGWYLIGDAHNAPFNAWLRDFLRDTVVAEARVRGEDELPLHYHPADWAEAEADILPGLACTKDYQRYFRFAGPRSEAEHALPAGCTLRPVDAELLADPERAPVPRLRAWARNGFGTVDAFLAAGLGMCLEREGQIVAWCMPDCATGDWCELGVHTLPTERRNGYAAVTVAAAVAGCLAKGYTHIGWHCWSANDASANLAQKVGFRELRTHPAFLIDTRRRRVTKQAVNRRGGEPNFDLAAWEKISC